MAADDSVAISLPSRVPGLPCRWASQQRLQIPLAAHEGRQQSAGWPPRPVDIVAGTQTGGLQESLSQVVGIGSVGNQEMERPPGGKPEKRKDSAAIHGRDRNHFLSMPPGASPTY